MLSTRSEHPIVYGDNPRTDAFVIEIYDETEVFYFCVSYWAHRRSHLTRFFVINAYRPIKTDGTGGLCLYLLRRNSILITHSVLERGVQ